MNKHQKGRFGENLAAHFLEGKGYRIIERNYRYDRGEIDIVAQDGNDLVFVEVKLRETEAFGSPEEAITPFKEEQLKKVAEGYLFEHNLEDQSCRFDVVAITLADGKPKIRILQNAIL
ncbi:MAG: YraN family protein [Bacteroidota bacterium]|jgi:putative endonuclease